MSEPAWVPLGGAYPYQPALELIDKIDLTQKQGFAAIPQDYDALKLVWRGRMYGSAGVSVDFLRARLNGDASTAYDVQAITSSGSILTEQEFLAETSWRIGVMAGQDAVANIFSQGEALFAAYAEGNFKQFHSQYTAQYQRTVTGQYSGFYWGLYANSAPITQIDLFPHAQTGFVAGSRAWLYGIRGIKPPPFIPTASAVPLLTTSLPASPYDGQEIILCDSLLAPTYTWRLRYVEAKASNKWVYLGGVPLLSERNVTGTRTSNAYGDLNDAANVPAITIPVAGDYHVEIGAYMEIGALALAYMSFAIGATAAADAEAAITIGNSINEGGTVYRKQRKNALAAGAVLAAKYRSTGGLLTSYNRMICATPVAIGG